MPREAVEKACAELATAGPGTGLWLNAVFQPPGRVGEAAVHELVETVRWGLDLAARAGLPVDFNMHPFYPSKRSLEAYPQHPRADQARLAEALEEARAVVREAGARATLFVGLHDERHDQGQEERLEEMRVRVNGGPS